MKIFLACAAALLLVSHALAQQPKVAAKEARLKDLYQKLEDHWHHPKDQQIGDYPAIADILRKIVAVDPQDLEAWSSLGYILWSLGKPDAGLKELERGLKLNPTKWEMHEELARHFLIARKDKARAIPYFEAAVKLEGCTHPVFDTLGECYIQTGQKEKALAIWREAVKRFPEDRLAAAKIERYSN